jgi:DNA polymerase-3 subunit alpha
MNGEPFTYYHDSEKSYMAPTYNTITYQEQFMLRVHTLAGWTLGKGDSLRKVKHIRDNTELHDLFVRGCKERGYLTDDIQIEKAWGEIVDALEGGYSFNKSHAASYADISYQTAWLKHYYPVEFMAALMTSERTKQEQIASRVAQCKLLNIKILPPDINKSDNTYKVEDDAIRYSINTIKGVGDNALIELAKHNNVVNLVDLLSRGDLRILDKTVVTNLIKAGCFDFENPNRYALLHDYYMTRGTKKDIIEASIYEGKICNDTDIARMEKEVLGLYITKSPFDQYAFQSLDSFQNQLPALIGGEVAAVKTVIDKNKNKMAFVTVTTQYGNTEVVVFAKTNQKYQDILQVDNMLMLKGKKDNQKLLLNEATLLG